MSTPTSQVTESDAAIFRALKLQNCALYLYAQQGGSWVRPREERLPATGFRQVKK